MGSMPFKCSKANKSPRLAHANFLAKILAPRAVTPFPTTYACCSLPGILVEEPKESAMAEA